MTDPAAASDGPPTVSVIVVSRDRPRWLRRCLTAISQLVYPTFEVIVVSNDAGFVALAGHRLEGLVKTVPCDIANISLARNLGLAASGGDIAAFIDDDSVPEPTWLTNLVTPFDDAQVAGAVGAVRGRNGISYQSRFPCISGAGETRETEHGRCPKGLVPKLVGTNMALRREAVCELGGFDEAFDFYLEDSDISLRLAAAGHRVAFADDAEVHHAFAASPRRTTARAPRSLTQIGRSLAVFLRKHCPENQRTSALERAFAAERQRMLGHLVRGTAEPRDVRHRFAEFHAGVAAGRKAIMGEPTQISAPADFTPVPPDLAPVCAVVLAGRPWRRKALADEARAAVAGRSVTTVFRLSPTTLFHHVRFTEDGYWLQTGGTLGRAERTEPIVAFSGFGERVRREWWRVRRARCPSDFTVRTQIG